MPVEDPWFDNSTAEERILGRPPVEAFTEEHVLGLVNDFTDALRAGNLRYIESAIALDFRYSSPAVLNGRITRTKGGRDAYLMSLATAVELQVGRSIFVQVLEIEMRGSTSAVVTCEVRSKAPPVLGLYWPEVLHERLTVGSFEGRPVLKEIYVLESA